MNLAHEYDEAMALVIELQDQLELMQKQIEKFTLEHAASSEDFVDEDFIDPTDMIDFLEDIGLDPFNLPSSLGERMAIRDQLQKVC